MKTVIKNLWDCRNSILATWVFFFCLSLVGKTPHGILALLAISGAFVIIPTTIGLIIVKMIKANSTNDNLL